MTLEKAIEINTDLSNNNFSWPDMNRKHAIKLSIEATKAVQYIRRNYPEILAALLPGETKD